MARPFDPQALRRIRAPLQARPAHPHVPMGPQPSLDGLRSVAVALALGFGAWAAGSDVDVLPGGFVGLEVWLVLVGYVSTVTLAEEWHASGRIDVVGFWLPRVRRIVPGLAFLLVGTGVLAAVLDDTTLATFRRDLFGAVTLLANWQQVLVGDGHFTTLGTPPLLRHLWVVAVESQWFLLAPALVGAALSSSAGRSASARRLLAAGAVIAAVVTALVFVEFDRFRTDLAYLSTVTRASGLLLGAALGLWWTPWRWRVAGGRELVLVDLAAVAALVGLAVLAWQLPGATPGAYETKLWVVGGPAVLPGGLFLAGLLASVVVAAAVHPGARLIHALLGNRLMAEAGKRAVGIYLWHWPLLVLLDADEGVGRLIGAYAAAVVAAEVSLRFVERPIRRGALGDWIGGLRAAHGAERQRWVIATAIYGLAAAMLLSALVVRLVRTDALPAGVDRADVRFDPASVTNTVSATAATLAAPLTTVATLPRRLVVLGDSQAHALAVNAPLGMDATFTVANGALPGCSIWEGGSISTARRGVDKGFGGCDDLPRRWREAASEAGAEVALVAIGAWDVFDVEVEGTEVEFGTEEFDRQFLFRLDQGVEALKAIGVEVALLEVPCMRPVDVAGAIVPALPERADDERVAHVNGLLRREAADDPRFVHFVPGPQAWCGDESVATDLSLRWDGVNPYRAGAKLVYETIAGELLRIPI